MKIGLEYCDFIKDQKELRLASEYFSGSFPREIQITSPFSGRTIPFKPVPPGHPYFDEDQWDGEMSVYIPATKLKNVNRLIVYHAY